MDKTPKTQSTEQDKSKLERLQLFFEHTDDSRVVVNARQKRVKQPTRNTASKR